jgi:muramoyltetrapeptide carboxypeptidase LdcA involved in peptidoglycan recycling
MSLLKPPALQPGDTIAAISLSSGAAASYPERYQTGKRQFSETFGVRVIETPNALRDNRWLHDNPAARADDLHWALTDDRIAGVVSTIGGDESIRTVPYLDLNLIREHPKIFLGFSDATVQHLVQRQAGVVSFHGPSLLTEFAETGGVRPYVESTVRTALFAGEAAELMASSEWTEERRGWGDPVLAPRRRRWWPNPGWAWLQGDSAVVGELIGGNAEILEMAKATSIWPPDTCLGQRGHAA